MKKFRFIAMVCLVLVAVMVPVVAQAIPAAACTQGLTPGYWKNHTEAWKVYKITDYYDEVITSNLPSGYAYIAAIEPKLPHITLLDALSVNGGKNSLIADNSEAAFLRHSTAALLNANAGIDYWPDLYVKTKVYWAYSGLVWDKYDSNTTVNVGQKAAWEYWKNFFESYNQLGVN